MKTLIVFAHPERNSFNGAMLDTAKTVLKTPGNEVKISELNQMGFDPLSNRSNFKTVKDNDYFKPQVEEKHASENDGFAEDVETEIQKIEWCDLMIWQFPLWWFSLPAVLKGWVDRTFVMGRVYGMGKIYDTGAFKGKRALLSLTTGGPEPAYNKGGFNGDIDSILKPIQRGMLKFTGFDVLSPHIVYGAAQLSDDERKVKLVQFQTRLENIVKEHAIEVLEY
ncbi:MAG: NAD(P)H-dependent oxidoreductase [SAR324 cluster bacterium]|nr:NAD(P)H-dependent oxidoreductase [SAR324 cluster bacterium]MBL7034702.1 NAD(P)H-dependent oxidoreductase [SAR324 cluster bacterium]